jgi:hypothetical protein
MLYIIAVYSSWHEEINTHCLRGTCILLHIAQATFSATSTDIICKYFYRLVCHILHQISHISINFAFGYSGETSRKRWFY